jgi:hypothetical protein
MMGINFLVFCVCYFWMYSSINLHVEKYMKDVVLRACQREGGETVEIL